LRKFSHRTSTQRAYLLAIVVPTDECQRAHTDDAALQNRVLADMRRVARRAGLPSYAVPRAVLLVRRVGDKPTLPTTYSNKVDRRAIVSKYKTPLDALYEQADAVLSSTVFEDSALRAAVREVTVRLSMCVCDCVRAYKCLRRAMTLVMACVCWIR
jgi:hypothetical protein